MGGKFWVSDIGMYPKRKSVELPISIFNPRQRIINVGSIARTIKTYVSRFMLMTMKQTFAVAIERVLKKREAIERV